MGTGSGGSSGGACTQRSASARSRRCTPARHYSPATSRGSTLYWCRPVL